MDPKAAFKSQYHASLAMLRETIEVCPDDLWTERDTPRSYWRIAYHTLFYTHWYLERTSTDFERWEFDREHAASTWADPWTPDNRPAHAYPPYTKGQILDYLGLVDALVDSKVDAIDLDSPESGFHWYPMSKFEHQLVNLKHIQHHVGQLAELLMERGIETDWIADQDDIPARA